MSYTPTGRLLGYAHTRPGEDVQEQLTVLHDAGCAEVFADDQVPRKAPWTHRGAYDELRAIADDAGLQVGRDAEFTPHVLRHTAGTNLIRDGQDIVLVAEILGQSLETTRRYSLPTDADKQAAIERLAVDE